MRNRPEASRTCLAAAILAIATVSIAASAQPADSDGDGIPDSVESQLGLPPDLPQRLVPAAQSPSRGDSDQEAAINAPDILSAAVCHVGARRLLFQVEFAGPAVFTGSTFIIYLDMDNDPDTGRVDPHHGGIDVMVSVSGDSVSTTFHNADYAHTTTLAGTVDGHLLWVAMDAPLSPRDGTLALGLHLLAQRKGGASDSTRHAVVTVPVQTDVAVPKADFGRSGSLRPLTDYRYVDDQVKLERLADKGLRADEVVPAAPISFGRPRPSPVFAASPRSTMGGTATRSRIDVLLEDESGTARTAAAATFGVPFPEGSLFDPARIRLLDREGRRLPAQFMATAFWRDDSIKWCRCDVTLPVLAGAREELVVEFGTEVPADAGAGLLDLSADADALTVVTGPLKAVLDKRRFRGLGTVWVDPTGTGRFDDTTLRFSADRAGVVLLDEKGTAFTSAGTPPRRLTVEMNGPSVAIVKVEGDYADASGHPTMSYIARLTFRAGSSRVDLAWTHVNTCTQTEFTDITSLALAGVVPAASNGDVFAPGAAAGAIEAIPSPVRLLQTDERTCTANGASAGGPSGRAPGVARVRNPAGGVALVLHEFWEHWPKALALEGDSLRIEWLPELPGPDFGRGLPHYLMYPFVEGKYRLKWGMSFTETVTLDFGGTLAPEELVAEARHPLVAVIPGEWYARTRALGPLAAPFGRQFKLWDDYVEKGFEAHMARKETFREYGFLNHGDWYGERGRNWGNNEYDFAHGLMLQFARTGHTRYFRLARAAARHQANVDIVHAYPDPFFVGANHQHSIGHTGTWTQTVQRATWSHRYDAHTDASNGHTWAAGMLDAWHLSGDPRTMDAALALGEHIAWAMAPAFDHLGSHERSAGWSLVAIMALYRATYDPLYLAAAARIAEVALREHKPDDGGAWPHLLPIDHAGGHRGARGNNLFLIGILVAGLADYHAETGDERVRKAVVDATRWIAASWDQAAAGWPYSAAPDGKPFYKAGTGLNMLVCPGVMAAATLTGEAQFADRVEAAVESTCRGGPQAIGKELAQKMVFAHGTLAGLQAWAATRRPDKGAGLLDGEGLDRYLLRTPTATGLRVRGPDEKVFHVRLSAPAAELRARRAPHGAKPKDWPTGTLAVVAEDGQVVATDEFSTDGEHVYSCALNGTAGETVYRVVIRDDMRGTWDLDGNGLQVVAETVEGFSIGGVGRARFHVFVPPGTTTFAVDLVGLHTGPYGAAAIAPDNRLAAFHESTNPGQARLPWASAEKDAETTQHPERGVLEVSVEPGQAGKVWALVLWGAGDLACKLRGIPPFLATTPDDCFAPRAAGRAP